MHYPWCASDAQSFAQEGRFLGVALDQMHGGVRRLRKRTCQHDPGETAAAAEIDPRLGGWREREKLERVRDVTGPKMRKRRWRDQIRFGLPLLQERNIAIESCRCFT